MELGRIAKMSAESLKACHTYTVSLVSRLITNCPSSFRAIYT